MLRIPRKFEFGEAPADEHELLKAFLKTHRFVVASPSDCKPGFGNAGQHSSTTNGLSTITSGLEHFRSAIGCSLSERRTNVSKRLLRGVFVELILFNKLSILAEEWDAVLSRIREKAKEMRPEKTLTGS